MAEPAAPAAAAEPGDGSAAQGARAEVSPAELALLASVFVVAACGLVYELAAGALASYLLGDSVLQFSTVIGAYLFAMGIGSWASRYLRRRLVAQFLRIELLVGLVGGLMPAALFVAHSVLPAGHGAGFRVLLYGLVTIVGVLVGLEIPLVMRILRRHFGARWALAELVSQVLTFDYLGALVVAVAFPLLFVPHLGLVRTGLFFGLLNAAVAVWALWLFRAELRPWRAHALACAAVLGVLGLAMAAAGRLTTWAEDQFYGDSIILRETSAYQRVVVTAGPAGLRLFLNGNLQFHARDEYRYHAARCAREILRYTGIEQVVLVELDPHITRLFATQPLLTALNRGALSDRRVRIVNADAFTWLESNRETFDVIVIDFPDPTNFSLGKLYTTSLYRRADQALAADGWMVVQTTSPLVARRSFWTVVATLEAVGLTTTPYHVHVPSFGEWGFVLAGHRPWPGLRTLPPGLRFLTPQGMNAMLDFPPDMARVPAEPNRLSNQVLVSIFEEEWGKVTH